MARLKRDERVCPFCAETIKASAIRCRYCQSDIEPLDAAPAAEAPTEAPAEAVADTADDTGEAPASPTRPEPTGDADDEAAPTSVPGDPGQTQRRLTLVLAALVLLAASGIGVLWWQARGDDAVAAPNGVLVGEEPRTEVLVVAADLAQRTLSYDYRTLDADMELAQARMTPSFRKEYDRTMEQVRANTEKNEIVLQAVAVSSSIVSATESDAKVMVFLNQTTTAGVGDKANQQASQSAVVITLERDKGDWAMADLTALG